MDEDNKMRDYSKNESLVDALTRLRGVGVTRLLALIKFVWIKDGEPYETDQYWFEMPEHDVVVSMQPLNEVAEHELESVGVDDEVFELDRVKDMIGRIATDKEDTHYGELIFVYEMTYGMDPSTVNGPGEAWSDSFLIGELSELKVTRK